MIKHIVFWKLKDSHEGKTKPEIADDLRIRITKLCESISTMK
ncbi:MAG: stress responsive protein, partial [Ectothiorhodospiraceae bacterium]|nr:stress responsive protein [Ectothiorhodospiraceae bacterium]